MLAQGSHHADNKAAVQSNWRRWQRPACRGAFSLGRPGPCAASAKAWRARTGALNPSRGLFWHPAAGSGPQDDVWCHLGFTGTAMWINALRGDFMRCAFGL